MTTSRSKFYLDENTHCYHYGEVIVPGVNEILGIWKRVKIKGHFYHVNSYNGVVIPSFIMGRCAGQGSTIHAICAEILEGEEFFDVPEDCVGAVDQFRLFVDLFNVKPIVIEGSYYSKKHNFAGTVDLLAEISGPEVEKLFGREKVISVMDIKTGKLSWTAGPQMSAYKILLVESRDWPKGLDPKEVPRAIISLPRDGSAFSVAPMLNPQDRVFFLARRWEHKYRMAITEETKKKVR